jgi:hypothetical protein
MKILELIMFEVHMRTKKSNTKNSNAGTYYVGSYMYYVRISYLLLMHHWRPLSWTPHKNGSSKRISY